MTADYYICDVFTDKIFSGAQIAVLPHADSLNEQQMAMIAREFNLSETVFLSSINTQPSSYRMRVFSPLAEIDFSGHPIIASAFVLAHSGAVPLKAQLTTLTLLQNTAEIEVNISSANNKVDFVQYSHKASAVIDRFTPTLNEIAQLLSVKPEEIDHHHYASRLVSCGFPYLIVPLLNYQSLRQAQFNFSAWSSSTAPQTAAQEILLFSAKTPFKDSNFNVRLLGPNIAINNDPPVGSAMPAFANYLCSFDFTQQGTHSFSVDRGDADNRRSLINIEMDHRKQAQLSLRIGGQAVMVAEGKIQLPHSI